MGTYRQEVTKIESQDGEKGPYKNVYIKKADGTVSQKKVWGELANAFGSPGLYEVTYEKQDSGAFFLTEAKMAGAKTGTPGTGVKKVDNERSRSIQAQCAAKASAAVLAGYAAGGMVSTEILALIPKLSHAFMEAIDKADAPVPKDIEEVPF